VAKQPDPAAQSNGFENVDREMQLPAGQNGEVRHLSAATALLLPFREGPKYA
jgi:hypothetical protein